MQKYKKLTKNKRKKLIEKITSALQQEEGILFAYVFGSILQEDKLIKDIDIAVYFSDKFENNFEKELSLGSKIESLIDYEISIDLVVLNETPYYLAYEAIQGKIIIDNDHDKLTDFIENISKKAIVNDYYRKKRIEYSLET